VKSRIVLFAGMLECISQHHRDWFISRFNLELPLLSGLFQASHQERIAVKGAKLLYSTGAFVHIKFYFNVTLEPRLLRKRWIVWHDIAYKVLNIRANKLNGAWCF
jgi:hypothetical protein